MIPEILKRDNIGLKILSFINNHQKNWNYAQRIRTQQKIDSIQSVNKYLERFKDLRLINKYEKQGRTVLYSITKKGKEILNNLIKLKRLL